MSRSSRLECPTHGLSMSLANVESVHINSAITDPQNPWSPPSLSSHVMQRALQTGNGVCRWGEWEFRCPRVGGGVSQDTHEHTLAGARAHQAPWWNRKARTTRTRVVRPCGQIGRTRVVLGSCRAERTREGGGRRVGMGGVTFSLHTYRVVA
jgi:hypothetical protein